MDEIVAGQIEDKLKTGGSYMSKPFTDVIAIAVQEELDSRITAAAINGQTECAYRAFIAHAVATAMDKNIAWEGRAVSHWYDACMNMAVFYCL